MMGVVHHYYFREFNQKGFTTLTTLFALAAIGVGLTAGLIIPRLQNPQTTQSQANENPLVSYVGNRDIGIQINGPTRPSGWDYQIKGTMCFNLNPPSDKGKFRVELFMPTKDNPAGENIGASGWEFVTNPATLRCDAREAIKRDATYTGVFNIPDKSQWLEACPEIQVHVKTEGPWDYTPQSRVGTINRSLLCPDGVPPSTAPTEVPPSVAPSTVPPTAAPNPTTPPAVTQPPTTPVPSDPGFSLMDGRITVYSCTKPKAVLVTLCDENSSKCIEVPYSDQLFSEQTVWSLDQTADRTHLYSYLIARDPNNERLRTGQKYTIKSVSAQINVNGEVKTFTSAGRDKATSAAPATQDFTINTKDESCSCEFRAKAYVKNADTGEITTVLDKASETSSLENGISNDMQIAARGSRPLMGFTSGEADTGQLDFWTTRGNKEVNFPYGPFGQDGLAHVRLFAPKHNVVSQECVSSGEIDACPAGFTDDKLTGFENGEKGKDFRDLRIACGVNIAYGWTIKEKPALELTPSPSQAADAPGDSTTPPAGQTDRFSHDSLLTERAGFGAGVTGGQGGQLLTVTSLHDNKDPIEPGTLRWALQQQGPAIVRFAVNGTIQLKDDIDVTSNKTLDGRGADIVITRSGLNIEDVENVIITNVTLTQGNQTGHSECNTVGNGDAIQIRNSKRVWAHHVTLSAYCDGLLDIVSGSQEITLSWSKLEHHSKTMLIGNSNEREEIDKNITATLHHNVFSNVVQRVPRVRFGKVDVVNNYYYNWRDYAVGHSNKSQVIVEGNIFEPTQATDDDGIQVARDQIGEDPQGGFARVSGNLLLNNARERSTQPEKVFTRPYTFALDQPTDALKQKLSAEAGAQPSSFFEQRFGGSIPNYDTDFNDDGVTNTTDLASCITEYGMSGQNLVCDINTDGFVNAVDYSGVINNLVIAE